jgi:hypothetical protein
MSSSGSALRAIHTDHQAKNNNALKTAIETALGQIPQTNIRDFLARYYRVERTWVAHGEVPRKFGWQLLRDVSRDLDPAPCAPQGGCRAPAPAKSHSLDTSYTFQPLPARPAGSLDGEAFCRTRIWGIVNPQTNAAWKAREDAIFDEIKRGNMPPFLQKWKRVPVRFRQGGQSIEGAIFVTPDYISIGSDGDFVRMPMDAYTSQRVADEFHCLLPTAKMVTDIHDAADIKLVRITRGYAAEQDPKKNKQQATESYLEHDRAIRAQLAGASLGKLVAGHKKVVVISHQLASPATRHNLYFAGWWKPDGTPTQGGGTAHPASYADYAHGVRLVRRDMEADGRQMLVEDVLKHPTLHKLLHAVPITVPRYPQRP